MTRTITSDADVTAIVNDYVRRSADKPLTTRSMYFRTGTEGPKHDPYGYQERTMTINGVSHTLHLGLSCWYKVNGVERHFAYGDEYELLRVHAWERNVGMTVEQFDRAYDKAHPYFHDPMGRPSQYE